MMLTSSHLNTRLTRFAGLSVLMLGVYDTSATAQSDVPAPPTPARLHQQSLDWQQVAARLWSDSSYTLRQAALESYVDSASLVQHSVEYRDTAALRTGRVLLTILVDRPITNAQVGELLAFYIGKHPDGEVVASVALRDTTEGTEIQRLVIYMYLHLRQIGLEWGESFCIPYSVPEGLILDEGELLSMPRCDDTTGGNPWPVTTARGVALAYLKLFLYTLRIALLPFLPFLLVFAALYTISRRNGVDPERRLAGHQAGLLVLLLVLTIIAVAGMLTTVLYFVSPNLHPLGIGRALIPHHSMIAYLLAIPSALLLVVLVSVRVTTASPALRSGRWRLVAGVLLLLIPMVVIAYGWAGHYRPSGDFLGLSWRVMMQEVVNRARFDETMATAAIIDLSILGFSLAIIGPVAEECFWRGMALPILERHRGTIFGVVVSALLFSLVHLSPWVGFGFRAIVGLGAAFLLGLVTGAVFVKGRSLHWCVAIHSGWNALIYTAAIVLTLRSYG